MALSIGSDTTDRLARELAAITGESITDAVNKALQERLERCRGEGPDRATVLRNIRLRASKLPVLDDRSEDELIGYDKDGLFA